MSFHNTGSEIFIPDETPEVSALKRTTHLGIGAHQDDLEFMCLHGILECYQKADQWFTGVVVTDGRGSSRSGAYAGYSDEQMCEVRKLEQKKAAGIGEYAAVISLDYPSRVIKDAKSTHLVLDLKDLIRSTRPDIIYTHNPADKHDTHIAVFSAVVRALRDLKSEYQPKCFLGCEVWRNLDWMVDREKIVFDVSDRENLSSSLMGVFDSQISGGKRYDLATLGRKRANATYFESHHSDKSTLLEFYMDLTPLVEDVSLKIEDYVDQRIQNFAADVKSRLRKFAI